jgi:chaperonin GroES
MRVRLLHDRVLVRRPADERTTPGGILIPDSVAEKPVEGVVVAIGGGRVLESGAVHHLDVKVGDRVLFGKYSGTEIKVSGEELLVMREDDIVCVLEGEGE